MSFIHRKVISKMSTGISQFINIKTTLQTLTKSNVARPGRQGYGPMIVAVAQSQSYWATVEADIENYLKIAIPIRPPESVFDPMHHLTFSAPRTTASTLCVAACELVGGEPSHAVACASAIHLMHAAAYTHEHVPLTDNSTSFKPEIQHKFGPNIELLTGDGMIPFGFELLARSLSQAQTSPEKILRVIVEITKTIGSQGYVEGQFHESLEFDHLGNGLETIEYVSKKKEGELHACGAACGAILGGGDEDEIEKLRSFGLHLGMIKGMSRKNKPGLEEKIERLKVLALEELESFNGKKLELISGLLDVFEPSLS